MKKIFLPVILLSLTYLVACKEQNANPDCLACEQIDKLSQEKGQEYLGKLYEEIQTLSTSVTCTDGSKWRVLPIGAKACGGPAGFVAYLPTEHGENFIKRVANFTEAQQNFNQKWSVISDCAGVHQPARVDCVEGKPKLIP